MTPDEFRRFALRFTGALESAHHGHPDFRVGSRIFATLGYPEAAFGMIKLTPEQQQLFMAAAPDAFAPSKGAWGTGGSTRVRLSVVAPALVQDALTAAWHDAIAHVAKRTPKRATSTGKVDHAARMAAQVRTKKSAASTSWKQPAPKPVVAAARAKRGGAMKIVRPAASARKKAAPKTTAERPAKRASPRRGAGAKR